jgi:CBS domain containing-hemolysin-like protein
MDLEALAPRLLALAGLALAAAFFAGSETSLFALTRAQRERLARSERAGDRYVATLLGDPTRLTVTILLGTELVSMAFAAIAAGTAGRLLDGASEAVTIGVAAAAAVPMLLTIGEVGPRSLAVRAAEPWARAAARPLGLVAVLLLPVRAVVSGLASLIVRTMPAPRRPKLDEAELRALVDAGAGEGELEAAEQSLIQNAFKFGDRTVAEIMTHAKDVFSLSFELPLARVVTEAARSGYSRIPIHRGRRSEIVGILYSKDLVGWGSGKLAGKTLKDLIKPPMYVPKATRCANVFQEFRKRGNHLALVVDEYGRLVGLVTMESVLGDLIGPAPPEEEATS